MNFALAVFVVVGFAATIEYFDLPDRARTVGERSSRPLAVLRDGSLGDQEKEKALQSQSRELFGSWVSLRAGAPWPWASPRCRSASGPTGHWVVLRHDEHFRAHRLLCCQLSMFGQSRRSLMRASSVRKRQFAAAPSSLRRSDQADVSSSMTCFFGIRLERHWRAIALFSISLFSQLPCSGV